MIVQTRLRFMSMICVILVGALFLAGCCKQCASRCTPNGLWQSPTMQATRSLLLINTEELRILSIDGKNVGPSCVGSGQVREYYLRPGEHTIMATFRYGTPLSTGVLGDVNGEPLTLRHEFQTGHEYVAIYREHPYPKSGAYPWVADVATNVLDAEELYWSMEIADLTDETVQSKPEVTEAQIYCNIVRGPAGPLAQAAEPSDTY